ncbi:hypothetical protein SAMN04487895_11696 [Paenibacillus sophorae]|uniref:Uncharacterized protein n=1 Tax=Paenibacillus sophorae TaxID=1333845 RepID=A0A1H8U9I5_9BACL|nr:hypothetical protein SAMN04487895_11696 [Paenibacillus sophorae]
MGSPVNGVVVTSILHETDMGLFVFLAVALHFTIRQIKKLFIGNNLRLHLFAFTSLYYHHINNYIQYL